MKRTCNACYDCPAFYKVNRENIKATAGGWEETEIDGKRMIICRPGEVLPGTCKRTMTLYGIYCLAKPVGKKIGNMWDWTGLQPAWCPRLDEEESK